jgi:hypothetical protein
MKKCFATLQEEDQMKFTNRLKVPMLAAMLLAAAPSSFGQAVYGSIFGTVVDGSGAVIPGATVVVTDAAKGTSVTVQTNGSGEFTADHLIPDAYNVKINFTGFKTYETQNLVVSADTSRKLEAALQLGGSDQTVEVNADTVAQLKTDRADVATVFGAREIQDLPIGDRNFTNLQLLLPGAQKLGWSHAASENPQGSQQIQVDGQAFGGTAFELDGTDNQDPILGIIVINPNIDSLSESKITTQNYDAEFGKAVSSVVTAQTKSGSNQFHGSGFDYRQSSANRARDSFKEGKGKPFPDAVRNQFGGSIGGPIFRDKAFFFADYQGVRQTVGISQLQTVPTALLTSTCLGKVGPSGIGGCDFSEYAKQLGPSGVIYQKSVGGAAPVPYAGNVIPTSELSLPALALIKNLSSYAPNTTDSSVASGLSGNYSGSGQGTFNSNQYDVRLDYQASARLHAFGRYSRFTDVLNGKTLFGAAGGSGLGLDGFGGDSKGHNTSVAIGSDFVFNPKLVLDTRVGYYRYNINNQKYNAGIDYATSLGIPGENLGTPSTSGAPAFSIDDVGSSGLGAKYGQGLGIARCNCPLKENEDQFQLVNNLTKTLGNHSVKIGADLRYARNLRVPSDNDRTGNNNFGASATSNGNNIGGIGLATFVLGQVTSFQRYASTSTDAKEFQKRDFAYVQDTWRATQKLTLNYGLRFEYYSPESINQKGQGGLLNLATGYIQVAGVGPIQSNMNQKFQKNSYQPRLGIAYAATPKTVIRAGYGRSFDLGVFGSVFGHVSTQNLPVLSNQSVNNSGGQGFAFNLAQGPPPATFVTVPANGLLPNPGSLVQSRSRPTTLRLPTLDAWNLSIQQSVTPTLSFTIAYVGNKGTHTLSAGDGNNTNPNESAIFLPASYSITGQALHFDNTVASSDKSGVPGNLLPLGVSGISSNGGTNNQDYLRRYYGGKLAACADPAYKTPAGVQAGSCGWNQGIGYYGDDQDTHYNALQAGIAKTFTHGISFNANYAWQRAFDFNSTLATFNKQYGKGRSDSIREQQLVAYGLFDLPYGHNRRFLSHANGFIQQLVGGFQISPIVTYSSGLPFTLGCDTCSSKLPSNNSLNYVNGNPGALPTKFTGNAATGVRFFKAYPKDAPGQPGSGLINTPFAAPALDQVGTSGRNSRFGPHFFNADMAVQKDFTFREHYTAQLRMDAYNAFNHTNYGTPDGNLQSGGSISGGPGVNGSTLPRQLQFSARVQF